MHASYQPPSSSDLLRRATEDDLPRLSEIYRDGVRDIGAEHYSPEQIEAWAAFTEKTDLFRDFVINPYTLVLERSGKPYAFGGIEPDGHIASLYVDSGMQRSGAGTRLLTALETHARGQGIPVIYAEASEFSKPLFLRNGYVVDRDETVQYDEVSFLRYVVVKSLTDCG